MNILEVLKRHPVITLWDSLLYLSLYGDCDFFFSIDDLRVALNDPATRHQHTVVMVNSTPSPTDLSPFRFLPRCEIPNIERVISSKLFRYFDELRADRRLWKQSALAARVVSEVTEHRPEVVVFILIDGLSFADGLSGNPCPVLVDGFTGTWHGMRRALGGSEPLALRLYKIGYTQRLGFSYWSPETEGLTRELFEGFSEHEFYQVRHFGDIISILGSVKPQSYVQVIREGLDIYAHKHLDKPPAKSLIVSRIEGELSDLTELFRAKGLTARIYLSSDHGILWIEEAKNSCYIEPAGAVPIRYYHLDRNNIPKQALWVGRVLSNDRILALPYTHMRRPPTRVEWGAHGGISYWESLVPFLKCST